MAITLGVFGVAFAAFCVWLVVRIINRRERWAKWTLAMMIGLPALYVLSIGPAAWTRNRIGDPAWAVAAYMRVYGPINQVYRKSPQAVRNILDWYTNVGQK
jgi:cytochrome bd-type quinol oxidase subunit 1